MADFNLDEFDDETLMGDRLTNSSGAVLTTSEADTLPEVAAKPEAASSPAGEEAADSVALPPALPPRTDGVDLISPRAIAVPSPSPSPPPKPVSPRGEAEHAPALHKKQLSAPGKSKKKGLFKGLSSKDVSTDNVRSKHRKRGKTTGDLASLRNARSSASTSLIEVVLKSDWEHVNDKSSLGQKMQKELQKMGNQRATAAESLKNIESQNSRLQTWKKVLETNATEDRAKITELETLISRMEREVRMYERVCRDLGSQTKAVKASVQQGINFLKPYYNKTLTEPGEAAPDDDAAAPAEPSPAVAGA